MNIVFTDLFKRNCQDEFQIQRKHVQQAIVCPDSQQIVKLDNLELGFFVKQEPQSKIYLLVCAHRENKDWLVDWTLANLG